jgi:hypothetical protein
LLKFENEFIDIENHEFDGKKWEERGDEKLKII